MTHQYWLRSKQHLPGSPVPPHHLDPLVETNAWQGIFSKSTPTLKFLQRKVFSNIYTVCCLKFFSINHQILPRLRAIVWVFKKSYASSTRKVNMFEVLKYIAYILGKIATRRTAECKRLCHIAFALLKTSTRSETYQNYAQKNNSTLEISCCHSHCSVGDKIFTFWCRLWKPARHALYRLETISKLRCSK